MEAATVVEKVIQADWLGRIAGNRCVKRLVVRWQMRDARIARGTFDRCRCGNLIVGFRLRRRKQYVCTNTYLSGTFVPFVYRRDVREISTMCQ